MDGAAVVNRDGEALFFNPELFNRPVLECLTSSATLRRIFGEFDRILANDINLINRLLLQLGYQDPVDGLGPHLLHYENQARQGRMFFNELIRELIENDHVAGLNSLRELHDRLTTEIRFSAVCAIIRANQNIILQELNRPRIDPPMRRTTIYVVYHPEQIKSYQNAFAYLLERIKEQGEEGGGGGGFDLVDIKLNDVTVVENFIHLTMPKRSGVIIFLYDNFINSILHARNNTGGYETVKQLYHRAYEEYLDTFVNRRFVTVLAGQLNNNNNESAAEFPYPWLLPDKDTPPIRLLFRGGETTQHTSIDRDMIPPLMRLIYNIQQKLLPNNNNIG